MATTKTTYNRCASFEYTNVIGDLPVDLIHHLSHNNIQLGYQITGFPALTSSKTITFWSPTHSIINVQIVHKEAAIYSKKKGISSEDVEFKTEKSYQDRVRFSMKKMSKSVGKKIKFLVLIIKVSFSDGTEILVPIAMKHERRDKPAMLFTNLIFCMDQVYALIGSNLSQLAQDTVQTIMEDVNEVSADFWEQYKARVELIKDISSKEAEEKRKSKPSKRSKDMSDESDDSDENDDSSHNSSVSSSKSRTNKCKKSKTIPMDQILTSSYTVAGQNTTSNVVVEQPVITFNYLLWLSFQRR